MGIGRVISSALSLPAITAAAGLCVIAVIAWLVFVSFEKPVQGPVVSKMTRRHEKAIEAQQRMDAVEFADETGFAGEDTNEGKGYPQTAAVRDDDPRGDASSPKSDGERAVAKVQAKVVEANIVGSEIMITKAAGPLLVTTAGEKGGKVTIVLLPDIGTPCRMAFSAMLRSLRGHPVLRNARVLMVDLPGYHAGAPLWNEKEQGKYPSIDRITDGVLDVLQQLGTKAVLLCMGLGLGANISLRMIAKKKFFLHGQVLVGATGDEASTREWLLWQPRLMTMSSGGSPCSASTRSALVTSYMSSGSSAEHVRRAAEAALADVPEGNVRRLIESWLQRDAVDMAKVRENAKRCVATLVANCADTGGEVLRLSVGALQRIAGMQGYPRETLFHHLHRACSRTEAMHLQGGSLSISERPVSFARALDFFLQGCMGLGLRYVEGAT